jgi:flagella basal body P-ring formation protein FlgA
MNFFKTSLCYEIAIVLSLLMTFHVASAAEVRLRERVVPKASVIRLGDIAEISAKDHQVVKKLAVVPLMPAPAPDTERFLRKREIADMLAANGIELADVHFSGAETIAIAAMSRVQPVVYQDGGANGGDSGNRHAATLAGGKVDGASAKLNAAEADDYKAQVCRLISDYLRKKSGKTEIGTIDCTVPDRQLAKLAVATSTPVCSGGSDPWTGRQKFTVTFATVAGPVQMPVNADVSEAAMPIVVAKRAVIRGKPITAADVEVRMMQPSAKSAGQRATFDSIEKLIGMEAKQPIQQDEVVLSDQVQSPVLVRRGELISVSSRGGSIVVRTTAKAVQDGSSGDLIQVESLDSKQRYDARVIGLREASVFAPTRVASAPDKPLKSGIRSGYKPICSITIPK